MEKHAFRIDLPPTDVDYAKTFIDGFIDTTYKQIVIKDHNSVELFRIGDFSNANSFYLDASAPNGGNGSIASPFNKLSDAVAAIPSDGGSYVLFVSQGQYNEAGPVALPNKSNLTIIGAEPNNTVFNFAVTYTADGSISPVFQIKGVVIQQIDIDLSLVPFASIVFDNFSSQLINRIDNNPSALVQFRGGLFTAAIKGIFILGDCPVFGVVTVKPGSTLYASQVYMIGGKFELEGDSTLKTLGMLNPYNGMVNGTIVSGNTPTWLTDAASDATFTGSVNKTVY